MTQHASPSGPPGPPNPHFVSPTRSTGRTGTAGLVSSVLAALVAAAVVLVLVGRAHFSHDGPAAAAAPTGPSSAGETAVVSHPGEKPAAGQDIGFSLAPYDKALNAHDEAAFLRGTTGAATKAMKLWYDNMNLLGFKLGALNAVVNGNFHDYIEGTADAQGDVTVVVLAGTSKYSDPQSRPDGVLIHKTQYLVSGSRYRLTLHTTRDVHLHLTSVITGWTSLQHAPWDEGPLHVAKGDGAQVYGLAGDARDVDAWLPYAVKAAKFVSSIFHSDTLQSVAGVQYQGFSAFVAPDDQHFNKWFAGTKVSQLATDANGVTWPLYALDVNAGILGTSMEGSDFTGVDYGASGGSGVVVHTVARTGQLAPGGDEKPDDVLVHEFTHAYFQTSYAHSFTSNPGSATPLAAIEGIADFMRYAYVGGSDASHAPQLGVLISTLRAAHLGVPARLPSDAELRGRQAYEYYAVAASFFAYVSATHQSPLAAARESYANSDSPLLEVGSTPDTKSDGRAQLRNWQSWYRSAVGG